MFEGKPFGNGGIPGVFGCSRLSLLNIYSAENGWKCFLKMVILKETVRFFEKVFSFSSVNKSSLGLIYL